MPGRPGPMNGSKFDRIARNTPAIATTPRHSAMAQPYTLARSNPINPAISASSDVALKARPSAVR